MPAVSYEVSITVRSDLTEAFESFMTEVHIPDVMATGAFLDSHLSMKEPGHYRASYTAASREDLDKYLCEHSPRLREDVEKHFPEGLLISREEWTIVATF